MMIDLADKRRLSREELEKNGYDIKVLGDPREHPMFEINDTFQFEGTKIVQWLMNHARVDLNDMFIAFQEGIIPKEEMKQFYRDIGYSLCGFEEIWDKYED